MTSQYYDMTSQYYDMTPQCYATGYNKSLTFIS